MTDDRAASCSDSEECNLRSHNVSKAVDNLLDETVLSTEKSNEMLEHSLCDDNQQQ